LVGGEKEDAFNCVWQYCGFRSMVHAPPTPSPCLFCLCLVYSVLFPFL